MSSVASTPGAFRVGGPQLIVYADRFGGTLKAVS